MEHGPLVTDVLHSQDQHRSSIVWASSYAEAEFLGVAKLPFTQLDHVVITALVEKWRPETHTFHMVNKEMTVTLEDVQIHLGLPIEGYPVIGFTRFDFVAVCAQLLEEVLGRSDMLAGRVKMSYWPPVLTTEAPDGR
ncbi:hypothetical protein MLD38_040655 [Melastoma candidum]|nr:hypothetical protein MLD38_040655 [Melastoma candidum]